MSQVGSAFSTYELRIEQFRRNAREVTETYRALNEAAARFSERTVSAPAPRVPTVLRGLPQTNAPSAPKQPDDSAQIARQAILRARLAAVSGDLTRAETELTQAITRVGQSSEAGMRLETQRLTLTNRQAREVERAAQAESRAAEQRVRATERAAQADAKAALEAKKNSFGGQVLGGLKDGLLNVVGPLAIANVALNTVSATVNRFKEGFDLRATLAEQRTSVQTLFGDVEKGSAVFDQAIAFGKKYGFTQREMGEAADAAAPLIKKSTTAVEKQLEVIGRLASRNNQEGFGGATRAISELASGDTTSIVDRFNLSRQEINKLKDEIASGADVFQVLDGYLNKIGVSADVLANRTKGAAGAARTYEQSQEALNLALGKFAEGPGVAALNMLTDLTNGLTNVATAGLNGGEGFDAFNNAADFSKYQQQLAQIDADIQSRFKGDPVGEWVARGLNQMPRLTQAQFEYAQRLRETGVASEQAFAAAQAQEGTAQTLLLMQQQLAKTDQDRALALGQLAPLILQASGANEQARISTEGLVQQWAEQAITGEELRNRLLELIGAKQAVASEDAVMMAQAAQATTTTYQQAEATVQAAAAGQLYTDAQGQAILATQESANAALLATQAKEQYTTQMALLQAQTQLAANEFLALNPNITQSGVASALAAGQINAAVAQYISMTLASANARAELARLQAQAGVAAAQASDRAVLSTKNVPAGKLARIDDGAGLTSAKSIEQAKSNTARTNAQVQAEKDLAEARRQQTLTTGTAAQKQSIYNAEAAQAKQIYGENSVQYVKAKTALDAYNQSQEKAASGGKGKGGAAKSPKLTDQEKLQNKLLDSQDTFNKKVEDAELKHAQKLLKIEQGYAQKSLQQQRKNEIDKRRSRFGFYKNLSDAAKDLDPAQVAGLSAAYEADFARAQELARNGQVKLSQDYLALKRSQRQEDLQYEQDLAEARRAIKESSNAKERQQAEADLQRLQQLRQLQLDAQREEEKQLLEDGDDLQNERSKQLTDENRDYEEQIGTIADKSESASDRIVTNYQRQRKEINANTQALIEQGKVQDQLASSPSPDARVSAPASTTATATAAPVTLALPTANGVVAVADAALQATLAALQSSVDTMRSQLDTLIGVGREDVSQGRSIERAVTTLRSRDGLN